MEIATVAVEMDADGATVRTVGPKVAAVTVDIEADSVKVTTDAEAMTAVSAAATPVWPAGKTDRGAEGPVSRR
jgi:hypothetical protein